MVSDPYYGVINEKLGNLQDYRYVVERYIVSLKQLTVVAYPFSQAQKPVFITFRTVKYMQLFSYWEHSTFFQADLVERRNFLESIGLDSNDLELKVYYVQHAILRTYLVCVSVKITDELPSS